MRECLCGVGSEGRVKERSGVKGALARQESQLLRLTLTYSKPRTPTANPLGKNPGGLQECRKRAQFTNSMEKSKCTSEE